MSDPAYVRCDYKAKEIKKKFGQIQKLSHQIDQERFELINVCKQLGVDHEQILRQNGLQ